MAGNSVRACSPIALPFTVQVTQRGRPTKGATVTRDNSPYRVLSPAPIFELSSGLRRLSPFKERSARLRSWCSPFARNYRHVSSMCQRPNKAR